MTPSGPESIVISHTVANTKPAKPAKKLFHNRIGLGVNDIDRFVRAVGQKIDTDRRIDKADVKACECLTVRQTDRRR